jgi:hypothetical protein
VTLIQQLIASEAQVIKSLLALRGRPAADWDNAPTWHNNPSQPWDNTPSWDNTPINPWNDWNNGPAWADWDNR